MPDDREQDLHRLGYDERQESWYLTLPEGRRLSLDRATLAQLVSLYNEIHRGNPLTLIERQVLHALGRERHDLQDTVRSLYDFIDSEMERPSAGLALREVPAPAATGIVARLRSVIQRGLQRRGAA